MASHIFSLSCLGSVVHRFGRMFSRLVDIPVSAFPVGSVRWTISWIVLLSMGYTYIMNRLTRESELSLRSNLVYIDPAIKRRQVARLKRLQAEKRALDEKRRRIVDNAAFRLLDLPPELSSLILAQTADWPTTYLSLVQVSRRCQSLTLHACLPLMPVRLISPEQVLSFDALLRRKPALACLMRSLWVTPLKENQLATAIAIVHRCTNLRMLASNAHIVQKAITRRGAILSHGACTDLTLLAARPREMESLLGTANGAAFFRQLVRLRIIGERVPQGMPLPQLTHLSYGTSGREPSRSGPSAGFAILADSEAYPALQRVVFTRSRGAGGMRMLRPVAKTRLFVLELPATHTELEIWCDSVSRRGMWELCADPLPHASPKGRHL